MSATLAPLNTTTLQIAVAMIVGISRPPVARSTATNRVTASVTPASASMMYVEIETASIQSENSACESDRLITGVTATTASAVIATRTRLAMPSERTPEAVSSASDAVRSDDSASDPTRDTWKLYTNAQQPGGRTTHRSSHTNIRAR